MVLAATVVVGATGTAAADRSLNLVPFRVFQETWDMPQPKKIAQTIANIVMFIPLGFMLPTAFRGMRYFWKTALSLTLFSLAIETAQYFTGRSADIDDLMLNASGGILGYLAFFIISKLVRKKTSPANQGGNITIPCENCKKIRRKRVEYRVNKQGNGAFVFGTMSVLRHRHFCLCGKEFSHGTAD